jgi:hypothetical protein
MHGAVEVSDRWRAIAREAGTAAEHIGIGVGALGRASHSQDAYYSQAFFALSIGFERSCKIGLTIDHALDNDGEFLDAKSLKKYGHDLRQLLEALAVVSRRRFPEEKYRTLPDSPIHASIIDLLTEFADNVTRYYNLEFLAGSPGAIDRQDPTATWFEQVTLPVLAAHDKERFRRRREESVASFGAVEPYVLARLHSESGEQIQGPTGNALHGRTIAFARRWERMYVLQIARFIAAVMRGLGRPSELAEVPYLSDFYRDFLTADHYFRSRANWSIY